MRRFRIPLVTVIAAIICMLGTLHPIPTAAAEMEGVSPTPLDYGSAPAVQLDDFGTIVRGRSFWGEVLAPSTAGDGWSLYILFRDHIVKRGPWSVHEVNLQTKEVKAHYGTKGEPAQIHAFPDGRVYVPVGSALYRLNPKTGAFDEIALPAGGYWLWRPARDGAVFLCNTGDRRALRLDPKTDSLEDFGTLGHDQGGVFTRMWEYGDISDEGEILLPLAVDDRSLYLVTGQLPRAVWALDLNTKKQRMLFSVVDPDWMALAQRDEGCYALVRRPTGDEVYRLSADAAERIDCLPPRPKEPVPAVAGIPRPELPTRLAMPVNDYQGTGMCEADGTATVHYRPAGGEWSSVRFELGDYPSYLFHIGSTADGRLLCSTDDPYTIFRFDPRSRDADILAPSPYYTHAYGFADFGGKIYFAGYTGSPLFEYDPTKPWTYQPSRPGMRVPLPEDSQANPQLVARMPRMRRAYDVVVGADSRLYLPCSAEMSGPFTSGGGLGWYEPKTGQVGLVREGFEFHRGHAITAVCDGRYMVVATTAWWPRTIHPEVSRVADRVVTYDVQEERVIGDLEPVRDGAGGGSVVEWRPGRVVGRFSTARDRGHEALFFLLDVASQKVLGTYRLPGRSEAPLLCLPDGHLIGYHDGGIYKLDPAKWAFEPVCKLGTAPRDWCVVEGQVYAFLGTRLVRITNVP